MMKKAKIAAIISVLVMVGCVTVNSQGTSSESAEVIAEPEAPKPPQNATLTAKPTEPTPPAQPEAPQETEEMTDDFAFNLYRKLAVQGENMFFSPFSISAALGMTYAGAKGNTEKQMAMALGFPIPQDALHDEMAKNIPLLNVSKDVELINANAIWPAKTFTLNPEFKKLVKSKYAATAKALNYSKPDKAMKAINGWVKRHTKNNIKEIVQKHHVDANTLLVLTNAIYFNGPWGEKFDTGRTTVVKFYVDGSNTVEASMMNRVGEAGFFEDDDVQVMELPYQGDRFSMIAVLPNHRDGLARLEKTLSKEQVDRWVGKLVKRKVIINLPKFKIDSEFELKKALVALGMVDAFSGAADFSGMEVRKDQNNLGQLQVSEVIHKAVVDVTEEGTEAAAATAVLMRKGGARPAKFYPNHPFVFIIRDKETNKDLFVGRIVDPTK